MEPRGESASDWAFYCCEVVWTRTPYEPGQMNSMASQAREGRVACSLVLRRLPDVDR